MSGELEMTVANLDPLVGRLNGSTALLEAELLAAMQRSTLAVQKTAMEVSPVDTGTLRRAWTVKATALEGVVANNVPYAPTMEYGRRAGAAMPPAGALLGWMGRKGIPAEAEFVVRRAISSRGIAAKRMAQQALERNRPGILEEFRQAALRFAQKVAGG